MKILAGNKCECSAAQRAVDKERGEKVNATRCLCALKSMIADERRDNEARFETHWRLTPLLNSNGRMHVIDICVCFPQLIST